MPCRPGICTHATDCRDVLCPGHPSGAGYAENAYLHLGGGTYYPREIADDKPVITSPFAEDAEPGIDFAVACWWAAGAFAAFIVAAGAVDWLMSF